MNNLHLDIKVSMQQLVEIVKQLSPQEKAMLSSAMWDDSADIPQEHQRMVAERIEEYNQNPSGMLNWDDASQLLKP
jgi:hypothetical protein